MRKLEEIQESKIISSYGGVGSIIETKDNGSLKIDDYDQWNYYRQNHFNFPIVDDQRLLDYIRENCGYDDLSELRQLPLEDLSDKVYAPTNADLHKTIGSKYFPSWFYCPHCRRLHKLSDWRTRWNLDDNFSRNYPACYKCSTPNGNNGIHRVLLEQVRFVLASFDTGEIKDVPFDKLVNAPSQGKFWTVKDLTSETEELFYHTSASGDGLQSVYVQVGENGNRKHMSEILQKYIIIGSGAYKLQLRNSNSLYYPNIIRSLYIPYENNNLGVQTSFEFDEFVYMTDDQNYTNNMNRKSDYWSIRFPNLKPDFIKHIYGLRQLKETSVLLGYSRVSNQNQRWYDVNKKQETDDMKPGYKKPFAMANDLNYLPAAESYGEGILFELDVSSINPGDRILFTHTFSHMLMKELEFQCGYPVSSIREKIYTYDKEPDRVGFLIYTIAGSEGSFGGLMALLPIDRNSETAPILNLIKSAELRVRHCDNDPICSNEGGHCFACLDLPETSCQYWNKNLDRKAVLKYLPDVEAPVEKCENKEFIIDDTPLDE